ncbi:MAG: hypothetical protein HOI51_02935 [Nitrosomonadales bacterium]|nr:hypothetical protein [Nitrosomonadales bacterium]
MKKNNGLNQLEKIKNTSYISLLSSGSTIVCCALPAILVAIGAGATLSTFIHYFPQIVFLSVYKTPIFIGAFIMLIIASIAYRQAQNLPCPADQELAEKCQQLRHRSRLILIVSSFIYLVGFFFAFILPLISK